MVLFGSLCLLLEIVVALVKLHEFVKAVSANVVLFLICLISPKHLFFFSTVLIFLLRLLLRFFFGALLALISFIDHEFVGSTFECSLLGDSVELFGGIELWIAVGMILFGEMIIRCLYFALVCKLMKTEDGCVMAGLLCALKLLTILAMILVVSLISCDDKCNLK